MKPPRGVSRDEWLLAIGLANQKFSGSLFDYTKWMAEAFEANPMRAEDIRAAAYGGAASHVYDDPMPSRFRLDRDAYRAGAALAMAMEGP